MLLERGIDSKNIKIIAKHTPGDLSHHFASPFAGATVPCVKSDDENIQFYCKFTFENLGRIRQQLGGNCGIETIWNNEFWYQKPSEKTLKKFYSYIFEYEEIPESQIPKGQAYGLRYKTWAFNAPLFIQCLSEYVKSKGVVVEIREIADLKDVKTKGDTIIFNCTGFGSRFIKGIEDLDVIPIRAQVVVVEAPSVVETHLSWGNNVETYAIKRPKSNELVLGGFYQHDNWNKDVLGKETQDILYRVSKEFPQIIPSGKTIYDFPIKREISAFRPSRKSGVRIQKEIIDGRVVIHNYGAGGTGYAQGLGMAEQAVRLMPSSKL